VTATGAEVFIIADAHTVMERSNPALLDEVFVGVTRHDGLGKHTALLPIDKAQRVLGYERWHSWRSA
jgi:UDP-glucose 4-epimerase